MRRFFANRWWVVVATVLGLIVGAGPINVFAFGVFIKPVTADLHIGRGLLSSGVTLQALLGAIVSPFFGALLDRWGVRRVMIPGIILFALSIASFMFLRASPFVVTYLIFAVAGLLSPVQGPIPYSTVTAQWFDRQRGLALGIGMAGVGLGVALMPQLAERLIGAFGWRMAYVGMAAAVLIFALIPVALFVREPPGMAGAGAVQRDRRNAARLALPGTPFAAAMRSSLFWALGIAFLFDVMAINGTLTHIVPLLRDRHVPLPEAVGALSGAGIALLLGRAGSGWCLDRFRGAYVAIGFFVMPMIGIALLASGARGIVPAAGAVTLGLGIGAEVDLMAFFVSRYFGLRDYAKVYGLMFALFNVGTGVGPALSGFSFDWFHSYLPIFIVYEVMLFATCTIFLRLGPYPFPARQEGLDAVAAVKAPA
ncbi:MAG TPA: MFS transporter [Stellaceae bacterium]|nr:MFS transporter [Stellaceae bacterium]